MPSVLPSGQMTFQFGPDHAPVSHSALPANEKDTATSDTCGQSSTGSSRSACLQSYLESRLRANLEGLGSPEYVLKWKHWDMDSGPPICALRAVGRRTSDSDCSGWATPSHRDYRYPNLKSYEDRGGGKKGQQLNNQALHSGPTESGFTAETGKTGVLNPAFVLWLMGYPAEWLSCVDWATLSSRKSRRSSSDLSSKD